MVTCGGLVTQSRGAGTRRAEPAGGAGPGPGRGGGTAPTFPASGPVVRGAEPPEHCLPLASSPRPRPAARHTILAGSGNGAERLVLVEAVVSAGGRGRA